MAQLKGEVKWFNNAKGYGFLGHDAGPDVFCHYTAIESEGYKTLNAGDPVSFAIVQGEKGPQAAAVKRIYSDASGMAQQAAAQEQYGSASHVSSE